jgi:sugar O-acyltransferase (sialic acid O-acetyltransferase NeuD family)
MIKSEVLVPLLNANEPEARLVGIHVKDGQAVEKGSALFTLETTKATAEVEAPETGFIRIMAREGDILAVGDRLAVITEMADEPLEIVGRGDVHRRPVVGTYPFGALSPAPTELPPSGTMRITKPARELAERLGIDLAALPFDRLVTESVIRAIAGRVILPAPVLEGIDPGKSILIYGGGGNAKSVMEMVLAIDSYQIAGIVDDGILSGTQVLGFPVLGTRDILPALAGQGLRLAANGIGGILDIRIRLKVFGLLESCGFLFPVLQHPSATVEPSAVIGDGAQVFANAYVGSSAVLHPRCMVNTSVVVSHDCEIGAYSHIAPGALLAGLVHVGERTLVGMGVTTAIGVRIGSGVRIGNGAIILADVPDKTIIQAGRVWTGKVATP